MRLVDLGKFDLVGEDEAVGWDGVDPADPHTMVRQVGHRDVGLVDSVGSSWWTVTVITERLRRELYLQKTWLTRPWRSCRKLSGHRGPPSPSNWTEISWSHWTPAPWAVSATQNIIWPKLLIEKPKHHEDFQISKWVQMYSLSIVQLLDGH